CSSHCSSLGVCGKEQRHTHFRVSSAARAAPVARNSAATPARSSFFMINFATVTASRRFPLGDKSVCSAPNIFVRPNLQRCSLWIALDEGCRRAHRERIKRLSYSPHRRSVDRYKAVVQGACRSHFDLDGSRQSILLNPLLQCGCEYF